MFEIGHIPFSIWAPDSRPERRLGKVRFLFGQWCKGMGGLRLSVHPSGKAPAWELDSFTLQIKDKFPCKQRYLWPIRAYRMLGYANPDQSNIPVCFQLMSMEFISCVCMRSGLFFFLLLRVVVIAKRAEVLDSRCRSSVANTSSYQKCIFQGGGQAEVGQGTLCLGRGKCFGPQSGSRRPRRSFCFLPPRFCGSGCRTMKVGEEPQVVSVQCRNLASVYRPTLFNFINYFWEWR